MIYTCVWKEKDTSACTECAVSNGRETVKDNQLCDLAHTKRGPNREAANGSVHKCVPNCEAGDWVVVKRLRSNGRNGARDHHRCDIIVLCDANEEVPGQSGQHG